MNDDDEIRRFYGLDPSVDISDNVPIISPNSFYIPIDGRVESLSEYFMPRHKSRVENKAEWDLTDIVQKPLNVSTILLTGELYYDTEFVPDMIVGHFQGYRTKSSNPKLVDPKKMADFLRVFTVEELDTMERIIDSGKKVDYSVFVPKLSPKNFGNYLIDARNRAEDPKCEDTSFFYFNAMSIKKSFYCYLSSRRIKDFPKAGHLTYNGKK